MYEKIGLVYVPMGLTFCLTFVPGYARFAEFALSLMYICFGTYYSILGYNGTTSWVLWVSILLSASFRLT